jgi:hypothetical protein
MDIVSISVEHMKKRCYFISIVCGVSLYNWYNYSLFEPIVNDFFTPYYQNCLFVLFYLFWDTYKMILSQNCVTLFRQELVIHHVVSIISCLSLFNIASLVTNHILIMECISIMNYVWRNNPKLLRIYRTLCIFLIRTPLSFWLYFYYTPNILFPYFKLTQTYYHYLYLLAINNTFLVYIVYDMFILWQIYKPKKIKQ